MTANNMSNIHFSPDILSTLKSDPHLPKKIALFASMTALKKL